MLRETTKQERVKTKISLKLVVITQDKYLQTARNLPKFMPHDVTD